MSKAYIIYGLGFIILEPFVLSMFLIGCGPMTPEEKSKLVKGSLDASRATCLLLADPTVPRDAELELRCSIAMMGCPKLTIKEEVRKVP